MSKLPYGWATTTFAAVTSSKSGNSKLIKGKLLSEEVKGSFPAYSASGQDVWRYSFEHEGDGIVVSAVGARCGKAFLASGRWSAIANTHIVWPYGEVNARFLFKILNNESFWEKGGSAQPFVKVASTLAREISLPPLPEQRRIVAKIDSLSAKSARARNHLDHIPRLVEKYKQAILAAAFRGDLTREWRARHNIDAAWSESTIGQVARIASGQTPKGIDTAVAASGDVPWFKVSSMNEADNLEGLRTSKFNVSRSAAAKLGLRSFPINSVVFPKRGGAIATNKKRRLLVEGALDLNVMVLTAERVRPGFLWWWVQKLDLASISNGSNVPQINNGDVEPLNINVPSPIEQNEIAHRLETVSGWIDRLAKEATSARKLVDHLDQAVFTKAFRGELVPQDPNDEPASVLLERISAERGAGGKTGRGRRPLTA